MPGPEGPAYRGWLGVVTGISAASTGGVLVFTVSSNAVHVIQFTFTLAWICAWQSSAYLTVTSSLTLCDIWRTGSGRLGRQLTPRCHSSPTRSSLWRSSGLRQFRARTSTRTQYSTFTRWLSYGSANVAHLWSFVMFMGLLHTLICS